MQRFFMLSLVAVFAIGLMGCGAGIAIDNSPTAQGLFAEQGGTHDAVRITPGQSHKVTGYAKEGSAEAKSILGIVNLGDASLKAAAEAGGISEIEHATVDKTGILNVFATKTVTVYGN